MFAGTGTTAREISPPPNFLNGAQGSAVAATQSASVSASSFTDLSSRQSGAAVSSDGSVDVSSSAFSNVTSTSDGGAIWARGNADVRSSSFARTASLRGSGGAVFTAANATVGAGSTFTSCAASSRGGAVWAQSAALADSNFTDTQSRLEGGAAFGALSVSADRCRFNGTASLTANGGALASGVLGAGVSVSASVFSGVQAQGDGGAVSSGAAVAVRGGTVFSNISSARRGGAVWTARLDMTQTAVLDVRSTREVRCFLLLLGTFAPSFMHRSRPGRPLDSGADTTDPSPFAPAQGGAVYATEVTVTASNFSRVSSLGADGGAIWAAASALVAGSSFADASAPTGSGGAVMCSGVGAASPCNATVVSSAFSNVSSAKRGGGVSSQGSAAFVNSSVAGGSSATVSTLFLNLPSRAALYVLLVVSIGSQHKVLIPSPPVLCAPQEGGGCIYGLISVSVVNSSLTGCTSALGGGGAASDGDMEIRGSSFLGCAALGGPGGAASAVGEGYAMIVDGSRFSSCTAAASSVRAREMQLFTGLRSSFRPQTRRPERSLILCQCVCMAAGRRTCSDGHRGLSLSDQQLQRQGTA